ncbi:MAG TPA: stage 0 sporulation family protein [Oscillospiraceae bacterium]|nr:stage 0 sporulation family protein [Oscillospiraceae bacterium]
MAEVIGVRFKEVGKVYYFDPDGKAYNKGERVIVETSRGIECGEVMMENREVAEENIVRPLKMIIRLVTDEDIETIGLNRKKEEEAFEVCLKKADELRLDMKLIDVEMTFDGSKILFYFTADGRIDFRELVKGLASVFRTRIEMRQICVRDESKMLGGLGVCGRAFCCSEFLPEFHPVSIKMAKEQGLSLNPVKISGTCGRLMCCLKYEQESYEHLSKINPRVGSTVKTEDGIGKVIENNLIAGLVKVVLKNKEEAAPVIYSIKDVKIVGSKQNVQ